MIAVTIILAMPNIGIELFIREREGKRPTLNVVRESFVRGRKDVGEKKKKTRREES